MEKKIKNGNINYEKRNIRYAFGQIDVKVNIKDGLFCFAILQLCHNGWTSNIFKILSYPGCHTQR